MLLQNHCYVDGADRLCRTPLHIAAAAGLDRAVAALLSAGASTHSRDLDGNTPLHLAYAYGSASTIVRLEQVSAITWSLSAFVDTMTGVYFLFLTLFR